MNERLGELELAVVAACCRPREWEWSAEGTTCRREEKQQLGDGDGPRRARVRADETTKGRWAGAAASDTSSKHSARAALLLQKLKLHQPRRHARLGKAARLATATRASHWLRAY